MVDKNFFRDELPLLVQGYGGTATVLIHSSQGDMHVVSGVVKTDDGYGVFEVYLDAFGRSPIIMSTSGDYDFTDATPHYSKTVMLRYEDIVRVEVIAASNPDTTFH